ncbi:MAG TPA: hypothetical protein VHM67_01695 [Gemmatimonadaceae bacterium]|nr:hypothetical protein [Gemmatimonadaceae bacterium]
MTHVSVRRLALAAGLLVATPVFAQGTFRSSDDRSTTTSSRGNDRHGGRWEDRDDDDRDDDSDDDRYGKSKKAKKAKKKNKCWDTDRNGYCDQVQRKSPRCDDRNYDGRCDDVYGTTRYPSTLPFMNGAILASRGRTSTDVTDWLGNRFARVRTDATSGGRVRRATWFDAGGQLVQAWIDRNLDGRADAVELYQSGRLVRTIGR